MHQRRLGLIIVVVVVLIITFWSSTPASWTRLFDSSREELPKQLPRVLLQLVPQSPGQLLQLPEAVPVEFRLD